MRIELNGSLRCADSCGASALAAGGGAGVGSGTSRRIVTGPEFTWVRCEDMLAAVFAAVRPGSSQN